MKTFFALLMLCLMSTLANAQEDVPTLDELAIGEWSQINPGGETLCARGGDYKFFVRPADSDKVMIHFQGGGACWDDASCSIGNANSEDGGIFGTTLFKEMVVDDEGIAYTEGIFDSDNASNPVADYNVILVTYCTADIHIGAGDVSYTDVRTGDEITVSHRGVTNAQTVMDWVFENFTAPSTVFINGCSAGAYGSIQHAPTIIDHYGDIPIQQLGDSGTGGLTPPDFPGFANWDSFASVADFLKDIPQEEFTTNLQYEMSAQQYPEVHFAQYNTFIDGVQIFFAGVLTGVDFNDTSAVQTHAIAWATTMLTGMNSINSSVDNFDYFVMAGGKHCILNDPEFYDYSAGDTSLSAWVADLVDGDGATDISCNVAAGECLTLVEDE